jgi:enoyl-CoA hydratase/carnithine racemase
MTAIPATSTAHLRHAYAEGVTTLTIDRPEKRNAITGAMYAALASAFAAADADAAVRVIVLTGGPTTFTAGNDLADFLDRPPTTEAAPGYRFMHALSECRKPVIAAVCGPAIGIGTTLLLHCDFVYVAEDARLSTPFAPLGLVAEFASSLLMPLRLGHVQAAEWLLLARAFSGAEAAAQGLANAALPAAQVLATAQATAARLAALPPGALQDTKALMRRPLQTAIRETLLAEAVLFGQRLQSPEAKAAFGAFLSKG